MSSFYRIKVTSETKHLNDGSRTKIESDVNINMNLMFFSNLFPPDHEGGGAIYCSYVVKNLIFNGHKVKVLTRKSSFNKPNYTYRVFNSNYKSTSSQKGYLQHFNELYFSLPNWTISFNFLRRERPDLVSMWYPQGITMSPILAAKMCRIPFVFHAGSLWPWDGILTKGKRLFRNFKKIFVVTREIAQNLNKIGIPKEKIEIVSGGVDTKYFKPLSIEKFKHKTILSVSNLYHGKGIHILIKAFIKILKKDKGINLVIIGTGDKKYISRLRNIAAKYRNIIFLGKVPHENLITYYNKAHIFVCPSIIKEGLPLVIMEAMSCGLPIVASNSGGIKDLVKHQKNGFLVEKGNINDLYEKISLLLDDERLRNMMAKNSVKMAKEKYDWEVVTKKIENEYKRILEESRTPP